MILREKAAEINAVLPGEEWTNSIGMKFRLIPAGSFLMGSPADEQDRKSDEISHQVTLTQSFWMGVTEVTQAQYAAVTGNNPSEFQGANRPVQSVSWFDTVAFCEKLSSREQGVTYRLPTEAEWEYACRAGSPYRFYWHWTSSLKSDLLIGDYAWYYGNSGEETQNAGVKKPNRWGLHDMTGNVWEWCADWYGSYPAGPVTDPAGPSIGSIRVLRGGCWRNDPLVCRSARRFNFTPSHRYGIMGFRVVADRKADK
ncbi:MAG TPA: formylglycine-generating enzyme family protein [Candidatus Sumerlaeota bacterium]|nr:formylglycine-generating enzyme family protein [Candidatus Sumerlaeota bacterium]